MMDEPKKRKYELFDLAYARLCIYCLKYGKCENHESLLKIDYDNDDFAEIHCTEFQGED